MSPVVLSDLTGWMNNIYVHGGKGIVHPQINDLNYYVAFEMFLQILKNFQGNFAVLLLLVVHLYNHTFPVCDRRVPSDASHVYNDAECVFTDELLWAHLMNEESTEEYGVHAVKHRT